MSEEVKYVRGKLILDSKGELSEEIKKAVLKHMSEKIEEMWREQLFGQDFRNHTPTSFFPGGNPTRIINLYRI